MIPRRDCSAPRQAESIYILRQIFPALPLKGTNHYGQDYWN